MSDRTVMKRRVGGLLRRKWGKPLLALFLAVLPMSAALLLNTLLMPSFGAGVRSVIGQVAELFSSSSDLLVAIARLSYQFEPDLSAMIAGLPALAVIISAYLFLHVPISVSVSDFYLSFLRGKHPKATDVYGCFSGTYPRYLGGMLYRLMWIAIWGLSASVAPIALYSVGLQVMGYLTKTFPEFGFYQPPILIGLVLFCIIWLVVFVFLFFNRIVAYSLTGVAIAAQPRLPAHRAVRLSRKLMRGYKWRLTALLLSFSAYYIPFLLAGIVLLLLTGVAPLLGFEQTVIDTIRVGLYAVCAVNLLVTAYVAPYLTACFRAFYIERKREALMDDEVTQLDFAAIPKPRKKDADGAPPRGTVPDTAPVGPITELSSLEARKDDDDD